MTREDVNDIHAYLSTIQPVYNAVTSNKLPFPLNQRSSMIAWDELYFKPGEFHADAPKSSEWNRGAYLVEAPGALRRLPYAQDVPGGDKPEQASRGYVLQGWTAPDITGGKGALHDWLADAIAQYLKTGHNGHAAATGLMGEVVELSTSKLTDQDVQATATYLRGNRGTALENNSTPDKGVLAAGGVIYADLPSNCHQVDGKGVANLFPDLSEDATVSAQDPEFFRV